MVITVAMLLLCLMAGHASPCSCYFSSAAAWLKCSLTAGTVVLAVVSTVFSRLLWLAKTLLMVEMRFLVFQKCNLMIYFNSAFLFSVRLSVLNLVNAAVHCCCIVWKGRLREK